MFWHFPSTLATIAFTCSSVSFSSTGLLSMFSEGFSEDFEGSICLSASDFIGTSLVIFASSGGVISFSASECIGTLVLFSFFHLLLHFQSLKHLICFEQLQHLALSLIFY